MPQTCLRQYVLGENLINAPSFEPERKWRNVDGWCGPVFHSQVACWLVLFLYFVCLDIVYNFTGVCMSGHNVTSDNCQIIVAANLCKSTVNMVPVATAAKMCRTVGILAANCGKAVFRVPWSSRKAVLLPPQSADSMAPYPALSYLRSYFYFFEQNFSTPIKWTMCSSGLRKDIKENILE